MFEKIKITEVLYETNVLGAREIDIVASRPASYIQLGRRESLYACFLCILEPELSLNLTLDCIVTKILRLLE